MSRIWTVICVTKSHNDIYCYGVYKSLNEAIGYVMWENRKEAYDYSNGEEVRFSRLEQAETEDDYVCYLINTATNEVVEDYLFLHWDDEEEAQ